MKSAAQFYRAAFYRLTYVTLCRKIKFLLRQGYDRGDLWRLALPTKEEVIFMNIEYILLLLRFIEQGKVSSITVTKSFVTIRIKK